MLVLSSVDLVWTQHILVGSSAVRQSAWEVLFNPLAKRYPGQLRDRQIGNGRVTTHDDEPVKRHLSAELHAFDPHPHQLRVSDVREMFDEVFVGCPLCC